MNARGISVFYGANKPEVALAEVRPPVGCWVGVARFEIIRPIKLLDLQALKGVAAEGSLFDPAFATLANRLAFLRKLSERIVRPVMPDDEAFDYLPTQAVADYLATEAANPVDGIVFPSVQADDGGLNVVLFHKAAGVERIKLPDGTETSVSFGTEYAEGWEVEYSVTDEVPPKPDQAVASTTASTAFGFGESAVLPEGIYEATLRIDLKSIHVHTIEAVAIRSSKLRVDRRRQEKSDSEQSDF